jgi:DNA (cytosine-5)-methyltransferase 1
VIHGSFFTGLGGFDLASEWMGWENAFMVENNPKRQVLLTKNFPNIPLYGDINTFDTKPWGGAIDVISGGFPCQPFSNSGKQRGKDDDRYLWPQFFKCIDEIGSPWVLSENVYGLITNNGGMVFEQVLTDLESIGYETQAFIAPASAINAVHRRDRVWIVAYSHHRANKQARTRNATGGTKPSPPQAAGQRRKREAVHSIGCPDILEHPRRNNNTTFQRATAKRNFEALHNPSQWHTLPQPGVFGSNDGLSDWLDRNAALGNAIVPELAYRFFKAMAESNRLHSEFYN